jgi:hypothetical protein
MHHKSLYAHHRLHEQIDLDRIKSNSIIYTPVSTHDSHSFLLDFIENDTDMFAMDDRCLDNSLFTNEKTSDCYLWLASNAMISFNDRHVDNKCYCRLFSCFYIELAEASASITNGHEHVLLLFIVNNRSSYMLCYRNIHVYINISWFLSK